MVWWYGGMVWYGVVWVDGGLVVWGDGGMGVRCDVVVGLVRCGVAWLGVVWWGDGVIRAWESVRSYVRRLLHKSHRTHDMSRYSCTPSI